MTKNDLVARIADAKARMDVIASSRPSSIESFEEYSRLRREVVECERNVREMDDEEYAVPVADLDVWWDQRTRKVLLLSDCSIRKKAVIAFRHAREPLGPEDYLAMITFDNVLGTKTHRIEFEEIWDYPLGIVGMDNLGVFQVRNSQWLQKGGIDRQSNISHFGLLFVHCLFECLSSGYQVTSSEKKVEISELFLREITLP